MPGRSRTSTAARNLAVIFAGMILLEPGACGSSPHAPGVVVYASGTDLESVNPLVTIHPLSRQVQRFVLFTTLVQYDSALALRPYLARRWEWSPDRRELTFDIATGLQWHDGVPTTAEDVAFTLLAARDPVTGYTRAGDLSSLDSVVATNSSTVVLRFRTPQATFPTVLCELPVLPVHLLGKVAHGDLRQASSFNDAPVGNGPFRFAGRIPGQRWTFVRNTDFPTELGGPPRIDSLVIVVVDEPTTKFAGLSSGDLDIAGIATTMAARAARDPTLRVVSYPVMFSTALVLNTHRPPFDDVRVRRAIDLSLDRKRIVEAALSGYGSPASGPVPPESPFAAHRDPARDPSMADSLLDAAGWRRAHDGVRVRGGRHLAVELLTVGTGDNAVEQLIQADLAERGMAVEIRQLELGAFLARARARPKTFDLLLTGIPGDVSLAYIDAMFDSRQAGGSLDYADYHTPQLDSLFSRTRSASTAATMKAWHDVQDELSRDLPAVWVYHSRGLQGISRRLKNVRMDVRGELVSVARWTTDTTAGTH